MGGFDWFTGYLCWVDTKDMQNLQINQNFRFYCPRGTLTIGSHFSYHCPTSYLSTHILRTSTSLQVLQGLVLGTFFSNDSASPVRGQWWEVCVGQLCVWSWQPLTTVNKKPFGSNCILCELCNFKQYKLPLKWLVHYWCCHSKMTSSVILSHPF